jgi:hypothetical protein
MLHNLYLFGEHHMNKLNLAISNFVNAVNDSQKQRKANQTTKSQPKPTKKAKTITDEQIVRIAKLMSKAFDDLDQWNEWDNYSANIEDHNKGIHSLVNSPSVYDDPTDFEDSPHLDPDMFNEDEHKKTRGDIVTVGPDGEISVEDAGGRKHYDIWQDVDSSSSDEEMSEPLSEAEKMDIEFGRPADDEDVQIEASTSYRLNKALDLLTGANIKKAQADKKRQDMNLIRGAYQLVSAINKNPALNKAENINKLKFFIKTLPTLSTEMYDQRTHYLLQECKDLLNQLSSSSDITFPQENISGKPPASPLNIRPADKATAGKPPATPEYDPAI